jgi:hypothetical protein
VPGVVRTFDLAPGRRTKRFPAAAKVHPRLSQTGEGADHGGRIMGQPPGFQQAGREARYRLRWRHLAERRRHDADAIAALVNSLGTFSGPVAMEYGFCGKVLPICRCVWISRRGGFIRTIGRVGESSWIPNPNTPNARSRNEDGSGVAVSTVHWGLR